MEKILDDMVEKIWILRNLAETYRERADAIEKQGQRVLEEWFKCKAKRKCDLGNPAFWESFENHLCWMEQITKLGRLVIAEIKEKMQNVGNSEGVKR